jgi:hypothetical protein
MSAIPLKIFLHGLIALVPTTDPTGVHHMTALLVDGRMPMQEECGMEHHPKLSFFVAETGECGQLPGCTISGNQCTCVHDTTTGIDPLVGKQISLEISPDPPPTPGKPSGALPGNPLPSDKGEAASFSYVANLSQAPFGLAVDPIYLKPDLSPAARTHLVGRMELPYNSLTACALATREDGGEANVHSMSFRKLSTQSEIDKVSYALAQKVIAELTVPDGGTGVQTVKLHVHDFNGKNDVSFTLQPGQDVYRIDLGNDPDAPLDRDAPCEDGVARHFMHFYELASTVSDNILIPHVRPTQFKSWKILEPEACKDRFFGVANRPICPLATFNTP